MIISYSNVWLLVQKDDWSNEVSSNLSTNVHFRNLDLKHHKETSEEYKLQSKQCKVEIKKNSNMFHKIATGIMHDKYLKSWYNDADGWV